MTDEEVYTVVGKLQEKGGFNARPVGDNEIEANVMHLSEDHLDTIDHFNLEITGVFPAGETTVGNSEGIDVYMEVKDE